MAGVGSEKKSDSEKCHCVLMAIKYLNFYNPEETLVLVTRSSAQQCS